MRKAFHIFVVGGGASAVFFLLRFARQSALPGRITICDRGGHFARGLAYSTKQPEHLLNVRAGNMGALHDEPAHFYQWLSRQDSAYQATDFVPRRIYGDYLDGLLKGAMTVAQEQGHIVELLKTDVLDIREGKGERNFSLLTTTGELETDAVILATGNAIPVQPEGAASKGYYTTPYQVDYDALDKEGEVAILGTGLSMVDAVVSLHKAGFKGKVSAISRHALTPLAHCSFKDYPAFLTPDTCPETVDGIVRRVMGEAKAAHKKGLPWQAVVDSLRPYTNNIWLSLAPHERKRLARIMPFWNVHRHRIAPKINMILENMKVSGHLKLLKGRVKSVTSHENGLQVKTANAVHDASTVINCLGYNYRADATGALTTKLLDCKIVFAQDGHLVTMGHQSHRLSGRLPIYAIGPVLTGHYFETVAVPELRIQAYVLTEEIVKDNC